MARHPLDRDDDEQLLAEIVYFLLTYVTITADACFSFKFTILPSLSGHRNIKDFLTTKFMNKQNTKRLNKSERMVAIVISFTVNAKIHF